MKLARHPFYNSKHPLYRGYAHKMGYCYNPWNDDYVHYGGRGIGMHPSFLGPKGFQNYARYIENHLPPCPGSDYTIDRTNNDGYYAPGNLRWAPKGEQGKNRGRRERPNWGKRLTREEMDYIRRYPDLPARVLGAVLRRLPETIRKVRQRLGLPPYRRGKVA
jgi:hypothetical protein